MCTEKNGICSCDLGLQVAIRFHKWAMRLSKKNYGALVKKYVVFTKMMMRLHRKKIAMRLYKEKNYVAFTKMTMRL